MPLLSFLFALVAVVYASVGFGGGSTYTALLAVSGIDYRFVPIIALLCNIIVVTGGTARFMCARLLDWRKVLSLIVVSAPLAFLGGQFPLKEAMFYMILGGALFASSVALFIPVSRLPDLRVPMPLLLCLSAAVGLLAGLSGIGGGIFMAPLLHLVRWAEAQRIAAFASLYILINSIAGVTGQMTKADSPEIGAVANEYWPLMLAVLIGGQLGSVINLRFLPPVYLRWITAGLVGYVAARLLWQGLNLSH